MFDNTNIVLDELDYSILSLLHTDGRMSFSDIARELDVAVNTVRNHVAKMVDNGILTFIAHVSPEKVGFQAYANILISAEASSMVEPIAEELLTYPEVSSLSMVIGQYDLLFDVMCYNNEHLSNLIMDRIQKIPGVERTETIMIIKVLKWATPDLMALKNYWENVSLPPDELK